MKRSTTKHGRQTIQTSVLPDSTISVTSTGCSNLYCDHVNCTAAPCSLKVNPITGEVDYKTESVELDRHLAMMKKAMAKDPFLCVELSQRASAVDDERNVIYSKLATANGATKERLIAKLAQKDAEFSEWTAKIFALAGYAAPKAQSLTTSVGKTVPTKTATGATAHVNDNLATQLPSAKCPPKAICTETGHVGAELESKVKALQIASSESEEREKRLKVELRATTERLKEAKAALDNSEKARQRQESVTCDLQTRNNGLKQEVLKLKGAEDVKAFKQLEAERNALKEENRNVTEQLHKSALKEQNLQRNNNELQAELKKSKEARAFADRVIDGLQARNSTLEAENSELKAKAREAEHADRRAKKEQAKHGKANKARGPQLESTNDECRKLSAEMDEAKAARLLLSDKLAESQRHNSEQQGALRLLEADARRAQKELEKHQKTIERLTEECNGKQRCIEAMSVRINEILDASRHSTRSANTAANSGAMQQLTSERQRAEQLERQLQCDLNDGARKDEIIEELSNQPACLICKDNRSEETFMVPDPNAPPGLGVCGHLYCTGCLDQGDATFALALSANIRS